MNIIRTVLGDIRPGDLGHTQCHEHLFIERGKSAEVSGVLLIDDPVKSEKELALYKRAGGGAIVDAQPVMAGRSARWQMAASRRSGVSVIAATGFHKTVFYEDDSYVFGWGEERIAQLYVNEIQNGMLASRGDGQSATRARAGLIKAAVDEGGIFADATYQKLHTAAAWAQRQTGAPLMCHVEPNADAAEIVNFYRGKGVAADRLWLAHLDRANKDPAAHRDLLSEGIYLEYDTIARFKVHSDEDERKLIMQMLEAGYGNRLLLGLDTTRARLKSYGARTGLDYILETFLPYLRANGATGEQCGRMLVKNPQEALGIAQ